MINNRFAMLFTTLFFIAASVQCRHRIDYPVTQVEHNEKANESLEGRAEWLKYKGKSVDISLRLRNNYKHPVTGKAQGFRVEMNGDKAFLRNTQSINFELEPGENIVRLLLFEFAQEKPRAGPVKLILQGLHSGTAEKEGKPLKDLVLELPLN